MTRHRIIYLLILIVFAGLYIYDKGYFFYVLLIVCVGLVPLQLVISLPAMLTARAAFSAPQKEVRGTPPVASFVVNSRFNTGGIKGMLKIDNLFASTGTKKHIQAAYGQNVTISAEDFGSTCGAISFSFKSLKVIDLLGIFAFPVKKPAPLVIIAMPPLSKNSTAPAMLALSNASHQSQMSRTPTANSIREYVDIREYRQGDLVRDIHWKLTAKRDNVIVREAAYFSLPQPLICFDLCGEPNDMAKTLALVESASKELYALERPHTLCWASAANKLETRTVASSAQLNDVLYELLKTPLPKTAMPAKDILLHETGLFLLANPNEIVLVKPKGVS